MQERRDLKAHPIAPSRWSCAPYRGVVGLHPPRLEAGPARRPRRSAVSDPRCGAPLARPLKYAGGRADNLSAPTPPALGADFTEGLHGTHAGRARHRQLRCPSRRVRGATTSRHAAPLRRRAAASRRGPRGHRRRRRGAHRGPQGGALAGQVQHEERDPRHRQRRRHGAADGPGLDAAGATSPRRCATRSRTRCRSPSRRPTSTTTCSRSSTSTTAGGEPRRVARDPADRRHPRDGRRLRGRRRSAPACAPPASTCCPSPWSAPGRPAASTRPARSRRSSTSAPTWSRSSCTPAACRATSG